MNSQLLIELLIFITLVYFLIRVFYETCKITEKELKEFATTGKKTKFELIITDVLFISGFLILLWIDIIKNIL